MTTQLLHNLEETKTFAQDFIANLSPVGDRATVVGLYGDLGAGKTSFTQGVAEAFGVSDSVVSPTFVIMKSYEIRDMRQEILEEDAESNHVSYLTSHVSAFKNLIHIDAYRLEKSEEMLRLGWQDIISNKENLVLVEWPERIIGIMPPHIKIELKHVSNNEREVTVTYTHD